MWRLDAVRAVGKFVEGHEFEKDYARRWIGHGYKTAFLPDVYSIHLGRYVNNGMTEQDHNEMYRTHGLRHLFNATTSAYDLNDAIRS